MRKQGLAGFLSECFQAVFADSEAEVYHLSHVYSQRKDWRDRNAAYFIGHDNTHGMQEPPAYKTHVTTETAIYIPVLRVPVYGTYMGHPEAQDFVRGVSDAFKCIPPYMARLFAEKSVTLKVGETICGIMPEGRRYMTDLGIYLEATATAYVPRRYISNKHGHYQSQGYHETMLSVLHEYGHALHEIIMQPGTRAAKDFAWAYKADLALQKEQVKDMSDMGYYLMKGKGGSHVYEWRAIEETFCEMLAEKLTGYTSRMRDAFPVCDGIMDKILLSLDVLMTEKNDFGGVEIRRNYAKYASPGLRAFA